MLGHKDIKTTQVYAKITKEKLSKDVEKLSQQLNHIEEFTFGNICSDNTNTKRHSMKRQVITIQESMVIYAPHHGEVWMTAWEIAELLNVTGTTVNNTIKRIWKQGVLKDFEHSQYIKLDNGYSADVYSLDVIIAIALQVDIYQALLLEDGLLKR